MPTLLSLFTGAGGLDLGLEAAGFSVAGCIENDPLARSTLAQNRPKWQLPGSGDIFDASPTEVRRFVGLRRRQLSLLSAGPPCQPFSNAGLWARGSAPRFRDVRSRTIHRLFDFVAEFLPRVVLVENVAGMTSNAIDGLRFVRDNFQRVNRLHGTEYRPCFMLLDAADYGVPQRRRRMLVVAVRDGERIAAPEPTHSQFPQGRLLPVRTTWDAIGDLDVPYAPLDLQPTGRWARLLPSIPEGENYLWHTAHGHGEPIFGWRTRYWSFLLKLAKDRPSWTLSASPGPATGPFHWRSRRLSPQELCRLQTFPRDYSILGSLRHACRQVGNAVPSALAQAIGKQLLMAVFRHRVSQDNCLVPEARPNCPPPEVAAPVAAEYLSLRGNHAPHGGTGKGPRASALWPDRYE